MVFQGYALWPHMTALRNVLFPLKQMRVGAAEGQRRAQEALEQVGLGHLGARYPNELSGGEQQRVALARALVGRVGLLLFDEPLSNLDADMREQLRLAISTLARDSGATSVYITHDQAEAFSLADKVGVLRDGRLVQMGSPEELYRQPASPFVARFTGTCAEVPVELAGPPATDGAAPAAADVRLPSLGGVVVRATLCRPVLAGPLQMFVRPAAVQIVAAGDGHFNAHVRDVAFAGRGYEHALSGPGGLIMTRVFCEVRSDRGETVGVRLNPDGCLVLPAERADEGAASAAEAAEAAEPAIDLEAVPARLSPGAPPGP
jgi:ABC-type Fe3+/spermidine/putrescine transport system ATPase subunit